MEVLVYNNLNNRMERYTVTPSSIMPYANITLTVREFRGASNSELLWTDRRTMTSWVQFRALWGRPIQVNYAFRRIGEGGHSNQSQHYAGTAFDVANNLNNAQRADMRALAVSSGLWSYVEPVSLSPTWVHFDRRTGLPACASGGYPMISFGSVGVYVCVLQDALETVGIFTGGIDGYFGNNTRNAVITFQRQQGLIVDGIVGCSTWTLLTSMANGRNRGARNIPIEYSVE